MNEINRSVSRCHLLRKTDRAPPHVYLKTLSPGFDRNLSSFHFRYNRPISQSTSICNRSFYFHQEFCSKTTINQVSLLQKTSQYLRTLAEYDIIVNRYLRITTDSFQAWVILSLALVLTISISLVKPSRLLNISERRWVLGGRLGGEEGLVVMTR